MTREPCRSAGARVRLIDPAFAVPFRARMGRASVCRRTRAVPFRAGACVRLGVRARDSLLRGRDPGVVYGDLT